MDSATLQTFVDVSRRGSFAAVARDRRVAPSSVSRTIAALESEIGVRLFHRSTRRLRMTEAGAAYLSRVEPLIAELEDAQLSAVDVVERPAGVLRVAAPVSYALTNVVPLLTEFGARHPDLAFDLVLTDSALDLVEERIDVAIRLGPISAPGLVARRLAVMDARVCASPSYIARRGRPEAPEELAEHDCLVLTMPAFGDRWRFRGSGRELVVEVPARLRTSNALALTRCALDGLGIALQATWIIDQDLAAGRLVDLFPEYAVSAASFEDPAMWIVYPSRQYVPLKVRVFIDYLAGRIGA